MLNRRKAAEIRKYLDLKQGSNDLAELVVAAVAKLKSLESRISDLESAQEASEGGA